MPCIGTMVLVHSVNLTANNADHVEVAEEERVGAVAVGAAVAEAGKPFGCCNCDSVKFCTCCCEFRRILKHLGEDHW
jgi:hypothetical protein